MGKNFYKATKDAKQHKNVQWLIEEMCLLPGKAIDLGCGTGRDSKFLLKNGWNVTAVDSNNVEKFFENLTSDEKSRFKFVQNTFEEFLFVPCDLVVANYSIWFCDKDYFKNLWEDIIKNLRKDGYFVGTFLGPNDSWAKEMTRYSVHSKNNVEALFEDFEIIFFKEVDADGTTATGKNKHWNTFTVIAKKK